MAPTKVAEMAQGLAQNLADMTGWYSVKKMDHLYWESNLAYLMVLLKDQRMEHSTSMVVLMEKQTGCYSGDKMAKYFRLV